MHSILKELLDLGMYNLRRFMNSRLIHLARSLGFPDSEHGIPASVREDAINFTRDSHSTVRQTFRFLLENRLYLA